jgi:hypothetical protein
MRGLLERFLRALSGCAGFCPQPGALPQDG